ncbi:ATP-binding protein [Brucella ciceri]|uniref:ATP-binding protein n=1 Tax=Brucella TaxID=234 RepID=UPI00046943D5|nr:MULTISPECIES: ATP-binding protein [Brucella/Ochrobactrum group]MBA8842301.1 two-component system sensor histidine kinase QseC [Ochrobactrum sp. RH1CCR137]MBA8854193.1 two-component system sensor histidine kinase QseC [Ochrobactrum sp. RH1CCR134]MCH6203255.1 ATP-binding protein [Brucella ciceri]MDL2202865.1 ATP-binding protein [Brucella intermedia]QNQ41197.1 sensor histidine kinase N-terminal domain-containing protein [Brucella intermedia]
MNSIRSRLTGILIGVTCVVWLFAVVWIHISTQSQLEKVLDARLMEAARMVNSLLTDHRVAVGPDGDGGQLSLKPMPDFPLYDRQLFCQIWALDGKLVGRSESAPGVRLTNIANGFSDTEVAGDRWRVFAVENTQLGLRVMVGDSLSVRERLVQNVVTGLVLPALLMLPVLALMIWLCVRRGLDPLSRLASVLSKRQAQDLRPLPEHNLPKEIAPAVTALNGLFQRVEEARERERNFAIFAAHELKTPLAGLKTQAQIAESAKDETMRANAVRQIAAGVDRTTRLTNQLLDLAALETGDDIEAPACEPACQLLVAVSTDMRMLAAQRGVSIELPGNMPLVQLPFPHLFTLAARNLIENAVNHSPGNGTVRCRLEAAGDKLKLVVEDDGPGIPESEMPHVTERFFRGANRNETGSGLGLPIVKMAVERMGGELHLQNRPQGGLSASIIVPGTVVG